jgi:hypothetical protein
MTGKLCCLVQRVRAAESFVADDAAPAAYGNRRKYSVGR